MALLSATAAMDSSRDTTVEFSRKNIFRVYKTGLLA